MIQLSSRQRVPVEIGIAPLVDCVFLLLIFFLLSSTFDRERRLPIELPASSTASAESDAKTLILEILPDHNLRLAGRTFPLDALEEELLQHTNLSGICIRADRTLPLQELTQVLDSIRTAGVQHVGLSCNGAHSTATPSP